jgi:peptidoglycan/LPS O-acetylase OafA/YrhL
LSEEQKAHRLAPLDGLRGVASFIILVLHYRFLTDRWNDTTVHLNPYWPPLILVYKFGWLAVEFFFVLSGFIFFWKYGQVISDKSISLTKFAVLRLSRLYPLHVVMLLAVIPCQLLIYAKTGSTFFYVNNDLYHFGLHLTFLNYGWFEAGHSFNTPAWSIALEIGLYFLFYALCHGRQNRTLIALFMFLFFLTLNIRGPVPNMPFMNEHYARVGYCFFMGGLIHFAYTKLRMFGKVSEWIGALAMVPVVTILGGVHYELMGHPEMQKLLGGRHSTLIVVGAFPALIIASLFQPKLIRLFSSRFLQFFGDISYSMYMIHFTIIMCFYYASIALPFGPIDFNRKVVFWAYLLVVIGLSRLSYKYFEKPAMLKIRAWWKEQDRKSAVSKPVAATEPAVMA